MAWAAEWVAWAVCRQDLSSFTSIFENALALFEANVAKSLVQISPLYLYTASVSLLNVTISAFNSLKSINFSSIWVE